MDDTRASILIAQDQRAGELALLPMLSQEGYRVQQIGDTRPFAAEFHRQTPALIVLDSAYLRGDAFGLCARLSEQGTTPILMITPNDRDLIERAFRVGASDVLIAPLHPTLLRQRVRALIDAQVQSTRARRYELRWQQSFERNRAVQLVVNPENGRIVDANPAACAFYGYTREEFQRKRVIDLEMPSSYENEFSLFNFHHRTASGQLREVKISSSPLEYNGKTLLYLIIFDLTKPKQAAARQTDQRVLAEALRNTAEALSSTLDQDEVLDRILEQVNLVVPSESANIMLIQAGVARVVRSRGYEALKKQALISAIRLTVRDTPTLAWMVEHNRALAIPNTDDYEGWQKLEATHGWLKSYVSAPIHSGNYVIGFLNIDSSVPGRFGDVDAQHLQVFADQAAIAIRNARLFERVRHQATEMERRVVQRTAELESERGQLRAIMDAMTEGVAYTEYANGQYHTLYVNQALEQMSGYSPEDWHASSLHLFRGKGQSAEAFEHVLNTAADALRDTGCWRYEVRLMRKDGSEFDAVTITTRVDSSDRVGLVTVIRDVSSEKALQQQKERFVAYASHELRTPITNLKTRLYLMRRQPERMDEHMRVLEEVTDRMKRLVEDLLDISRFERGVINLNFQELVLQDLLRNLVKVQEPEAQRKQLTLSASLPAPPIYVHADIERLAQVVTNLLTNAINYTPPGGRIEVRLTRVRDVDDLALVEVEDTGIGIAEEHLPHIFQPFYRVVSQIDGSGLGLSITQEIVELHGGDIDVTSQLGVGSTFRFWLPIIDPRTESA